MCSGTSDLAGAVDAVAAIDVRGLPVEGLQRLIAAAAASRNRLDGVVSRAVGELQVRGGGLVPDPSVAGAVLPTAAWLRHTTGCTGTAAGRQIRSSVALRELPAALDAMVDGVITGDHAGVLSRLVGQIDPAALLPAQPQLIEVARRCDPDQLAQYVRHLLATWCEPLLEREEARAEDRRFLQLRNNHNGSWRGTFELPDANMEILLSALEPLARRDGDADPRTAGQRRADALTDIAGLALRHADLPDAGGSRPVLTFVVPAAWAGAEHAEPAEPPGDPLAAQDPFSIDLDRHPGRDCATAPWTGPATRTRIQTLLCEARIQRVVLDEYGQVVSLSATTDTITAAQRRAVAARDRCCVAKGCSRPPAFCDLHHLQALADGGPTTIDNLVLLCRRHHLMWHRKLIDLTDLRVPWKRLPQPRAPALE